MATAIRLTRRGRTHQAVYRVVVADSRSPRDGKFLQQVGFYNPNSTPAEVRFDADAIIDWLEKGAQPSDTINSLLKREGIIAKYHAKKAGEDVSAFELKTIAERSRSKKPGAKATARAEAEAAPAEAAAE